MEPSAMKFMYPRDKQEMRVLQQAFIPIIVC
jgi:hypothetical protein